MASSYLSSNKADPIQLVKFFYVTFAVFPSFFTLSSNKGKRAALKGLYYIVLNISKLDPNFFIVISVV